MPRLTHNEYCNRQKFLKGLWQYYDVAFSVVPVKQQWNLHEFYVPTKNLTDDELRDHRRLITKERPALPHQAGKAYMGVYWAFTRAWHASEGDERKVRALLAGYGRRSGMPNTDGRQLRVSIVARPFDANALMHALVNLGQHVEGRERKD